MITLGKVYTDKITGFKGTAISYTKHLSEPCTVGLVAKVSEKQKSPYTEYFAENRLNTDPSPGLNHRLAEHNVEFGKKYTDPISGFSGVATGRTVHINGCVHVHLQAPVGKDGKIPETEGVDEAQLGIKPVVEAESPGGPAPRMPAHLFR